MEPRTPNEPDGNSCFADVLVDSKRAPRVFWYVSCFINAAAVPRRQLRVRPTIARRLGAILDICPSLAHNLVRLARARTRPRNSLASKPLSVFFYNFYLQFSSSLLCHLCFHRSLNFRTCCLTACNSCTS